MPIEIKELLVKVVVNEAPKKTEVTAETQQQDVKQLEAEIIKKCTKKVLQILKEKQER